MTVDVETVAVVDKSAAAAAAVSGAAGCTAAAAVDGLDVGGCFAAVAGTVYV